jgi:hypothetical protein
MAEKQPREKSQQSQSIQKRVFMFCVLGFGVIVALLFWQPFLSQSWLKNIVQAQIHKAIDAQVSFRTMDLDLFPLRFQLRDIVLEKDDGVYLNVKVEKIDASLRWKSFWREQFFFRYVNIESPTVLVSLQDSPSSSEEEDQPLAIPDLPMRTAVVFEDVNVNNFEVTVELGKDVQFALDDSNLDFQFTNEVQSVSLEGEGYFERDQVRKNIPVVKVKLQKKGPAIEIQKIEISDSVHNFVAEGELSPQLQVSSYLRLDLPKLEDTLKRFEILPSLPSIQGEATIESSWSGSLSSLEHIHQVNLDSFEMVGRSIDRLQVNASMVEKELQTAELKIVNQGRALNAQVNSPNAQGTHAYTLSSQNMTFDQIQRWISPTQPPLISSDLNLKSSGTLSLSPFQVEGSLSLGIDTLSFNLPANVARFLPLEMRNLKATANIQANRNVFLAMNDGTINGEKLKADFNLSILPEKSIQGQWTIDVEDVQGLFEPSFVMSGKGQIEGGIDKKAERMNLFFGLDFENFEYENYGDHSLQGKLVFETGMSRYQDFRLQNDDGGQLRFEGTVAQASDQFDAYGEFEDFSLDFIGAITAKAYPIAKQVRGKGDGKIQLTGVGDQVQGQITLDAKDAWVFDQPDFDIDANVLFENQAIVIDKTQIKGPEMTMVANGKIENDQAESLKVRVEKFPLAKMGLPTVVTAYAGYVDAQATFSGSLEDLGIDAQGSLLKKTLQADDDFESKAQISVNGLLSNFEWAFQANDQALNVDGTLVKTDDSYRLAMNGRSKDFPFLPMLEGTTSALTASWQASGRLDSFASWDIDASVQRLSMVNPQVTFENQDPFEITVKKGQMQLDNITMGNESYQFELSGSVDENQELDIAVKGYLPFEALSIVPMDLQRIEGMAQINTSITGPISSPVVSGQFNVERGYVQHKVFPHALENLTLDAVIDQNQLQIQSLNAIVGGGDLQAQGDIYLDADVENMSIFLNGEITDASLRFPEFLPVTIAGPFSVEGPLTKPQIKGDFEVLQGLYQDEWDWQSQILTFGAAQEVERVYFEDEESLLFNLRFYINNDNFLVRNEVVLAQVQGDVILTGSNLQWGMVGEMKIVEGQVTFLDNEFELSPGSVNFIDEDEITLSFNINARTRVENTDIILDIRTEEEEIRAFLSSIPPKEETTLISLLTLGVELDDLAVSSSAEQGVSASLIPSVLSGPVQSKLQTGLKKIKLVDSFQFIPYFSEDTKTTGLKLFVAKNLFSKVRLTYTTDLFEVGNENTFVVEQFLNDNVSIQGSFRDNREEADEEYDVGLDFEYRTEF